MPSTITVRRGDFLRVSVTIKDWDEETLQRLEEADTGTYGKSRAFRIFFHSTTTGVPAWSEEPFARRPIEQPGQSFSWTVRIPPAPENFRPGTYAILASYVALLGTARSPFKREFTDTLVNIQ